MKIEGTTTGRYWRTVPISSNLRSLIVVLLATQMLASGVSAPVVMKIGGWKKSSTMDIYLRLAGIDTKGATDCLEFIPSEINFADNVISIFRSENDK